MSWRFAKIFIVIINKKDMEEENKVEEETVEEENEEVAD